MHHYFSVWRRKNTYRKRSFNDFFAILFPEYGSVQYEIVLQQQLLASKKDNLCFYLPKEPNCSLEKRRVL